MITWRRFDVMVTLLSCRVPVGTALSLDVFLLFDTVISLVKFFDYTRNSSMPFVYWMKVLNNCAVMHVGIANPQWRGKRSLHTWRMRNLQYYVSGKRPMEWIQQSWLLSLNIKDMVTPNCDHAAFISDNSRLIRIPLWTKTAFTQVLYPTIQKSSHDYTLNWTYTCTNVKFDDPKLALWIFLSSSLLFLIILKIFYSKFMVHYVPLRLRNAFRTSIHRFYFWKLITMHVVRQVTVCIQFLDL